MRWRMRNRKEQDAKTTGAEKREATAIAEARDQAAQPVTDTGDVYAEMIRLSLARGWHDHD